MVQTCLFSTHPTLILIEIKLDTIQQCVNKLNASKLQHNTIKKIQIPTKP